MMVVFDMTHKVYVNYRWVCTQSRVASVTYNNPLRRNGIKT